MASKKKRKHVTAGKKKPVKKMKKAGGKRVAGASVNARKDLSEKELVELLNPKREIDLKITSAFGEMPEKFCAILLEKPAKYNLLNTELLRYFVRKKMKGVYVTVNRHLADLIETLDSEGIQTRDVIFVDAITALTGGKKIMGNNNHYVDSPKNLIELNVYLEKALEKLASEKKFVIVDSISTLLVYNKEASVEKFVHSLAGKIRAENAQGIFILVESGNQEILNMLTQFCDKVIAL